ncbi:phosphotransferase [Amycolatopsis sp. NPDC059657]|uniref:phosphotransferase n=1 Tax=Amycolatopsis sp. NPDC059657 TaxID=3346899 RepID=UPI0036723406
MRDEYTVSGVAAAVQVAKRLGLPHEDPELLHQRSNVLVRLGSVVARVPATTGLVRPEPHDWLARDVAVSSFLTERGVRVVSPLSDPGPGPHFAAGHWVTLWHFTPHDPNHRFTASEVATSLHAVHVALRDYEGPLPSDGPLAETYRALDLWEHVLDGAADRLRDEADRIAATLPAGPAQALHGDAHPGNLIATAAGPCWLDFEDTWRGPLAWDLGVLRGTFPEALDAYPAHPGPAALDPFENLRKLFEVPWRFIVAQRFPDEIEAARECLARYFA